MLSFFIFSNLTYNLSIQFFILSKNSLLGELIMERFGKKVLHLTLDGVVKPASRAATIQTFNDSLKHSILFSTCGAGAVTIPEVCANHVIELSRNYALPEADDNTQLDRMVFVHRIESSGTFEEEMFPLMEKIKAEGVLPKTYDEVGWLGAMTDAQLRHLFQLRMSAAVF